MPTLFLLMASQVRVVVYGGKGALGAAIVDHFKSFILDSNHYPHKPDFSTILSLHNLVMLRGE